MSKQSKTNLTGWHSNTDLGCDLKTILRSDRRMKRNPRVYNGKFISITRQENGTLRPNFKPMPTGSHFSLERYAFGVYLELHKALEGLVEE